MFIKSEIKSIFRRRDY